MIDFEEPINTIFNFTNLLFWQGCPLNFTVFSKQDASDIIESTFIEYWDAAVKSNLKLFSVDEIRWVMEDENKYYAAYSNKI